LNPQRTHALTLSFIFFLSGLTGLVYEIVWSRILSTVIGNTSLAIAIVVSLFMAGLATGSFVSARLRGLSRPLMLYGILEGIIGLFAILTPHLGVWINAIYSHYYEVVANNFFQSVILKASLSAIILLVPTIAMGMTLPLLIRCFAPEERQHHAAKLYGLNTAGAVVGTLLAGYVLLPTFGISNTIYATAVINGLLLIAALRLSSLLGSYSQPSSTAPAFHPLYLLFLFTGFATLAYEILWTRALSMYFGSSVYAFSAILAAFLLGIASGSYFYAGRLSSQDPYQFFSLIQFRISLSGLFFIGIFMGLPLILIQLFHALHHSFTLFQAAQFLLITLAVFYTTFLSGSAFPAALHFFREKPELSQSFAGYIYGYNTIGSILGSLCAGFVLIPWLGVERSIRLIVLLNLILGIICFRKSHAAKQNIRVLAIGGVSLLLLMFLPRWNQSIYNAGFYAFAYKYAEQKSQPKSPRTFLGPSTPKTRPALMYAAALPFGAVTAINELNLLYYSEGLTATVAVAQDSNGIRSLLINGKPDASNVPTGDMRTQLLLGHLPSLLAENTRDALVIGLGSGVTAGALAKHQFNRIDIVEIEQKVAQASAYFEEENGSILKNKRVKLIVDDGRNVVQHASRTYDVITSEPSNLWMSGVANLFTREFFQSVQKRLQPDGVLCQWIHLYQISAHDVLVFLKTIHSVFPHLAIWVDGSDMLILAGNRPFNLDPQRIAQRMSRPEVQLNLERSNIRPDNIFKGYISDERLMKVLRKHLEINTDDYPILEFSAPRSLFVNQSKEIVKSLYYYKSLAEQQ
jgi:spermidine synthase